MDGRHRFGFDPDSPGARHRARAARGRELVEIEVTERMTVDDARGVGAKLWPARDYEPGERMTLPLRMADRPTAASFAKR